jgi:hypothetical protein
MVAASTVLVAVSITETLPPATYTCFPPGLTATAMVGTGTVATTVLVAVAITETLPEM